MKGINMNDGLTISAYEIMKKFPDEDTARIYLEEKRWHGQPICPYCGKEKIQKRYLKGYYRCLACQKDFTVRTDTIFAKSHIPLDKWLYAIYQVVTARKGISSMQLSKEIGITQKSAWFMLQRIREACKDDNNDFLKGIVEADETYIGGKEANKHDIHKSYSGRGPSGKTPVLGIRERGGKVKAKVLKDTTAKTIQTELNSSIARDTILCTDDHRSYLGNKYTHFVVNHSAKQYVDGMAHTNGIESVWALLKRGFYGIYHSFSNKHLQRYVNEFMYRLNEGNCKIPTMDRIDALLSKAFGKRITYANLTT